MPLKSGPKANEYNRVWRKNNRERANETARTYYANNVEHLRSYHKKWSGTPERIDAMRVRSRKHLLAQYSLSPEDYDAMLFAQDGHCKICPAGPGARRLAVDHDHVTGKVRGLLCPKCNSSLGWMEQYGARANEYLGVETEAIEDRRTA